MITIDEKIAIPLGELKFSASRSSGPGGQHVNKTSTRMTLIYNVKNSAALDEEQRQLLLQRLASRLTKQGELTISSEKYRSQHANKLDVMAKFAEILSLALEKPRIRKRTKIPHSVHVRRLEKKRQRKEIKQSRGRIKW